jgi:DNA repair photolyase
MNIEFRELKGDVIHDFPYKRARRKCAHTALISVTHSGSCVHRCPMCYARAYVWSIDDKIVIYKNVPEKLEAEIKKSYLLPPFYISQVSDALQPVPQVREITFKVVRILMKYNLSFHILTKSAQGVEALVETIPELIKYPYWYIGITIEAPPLKQEVTSPFASSIEERFRIIRRLTKYGITVVGRSDPTILGFVETKEVCEVIRKFASIGVKHVVGSLGYYNPISMGRLINSIYHSKWRDKIPSVEKIYSFKADQINQYPRSKRFSAPFSTRVKFHSILKKETEKYGLTYSVCLELPKEYDSKGIMSCDGGARNFVHIRGKEDKFYPINCCGDCLRSCPNLSTPPCKKPSLQYEYPYLRQSIRIR